MQCDYQISGWFLIFTRLQQRGMEDKPGDLQINDISASVRVTSSCPEEITMDS